MVFKKRRQMSQRKKSLATVAGLALVMGTFGILWALGRNAPVETSIDHDSLPAGRQPAGLDQPCAGDGVQVSLDKAEGDMPFHILVPASQLANQTDLTGVWECGRQAVQMQFSSGVKITMEINTNKDPAAAWQSLADQDPSTTSVSVVRGQPASLIDPAKDSTHTIDGGVSVVDDGLLITVGGNGKIAIGDLVEVTESLS
jgi:hypothetical protein